MIQLRADPARPTSTIGIWGPHRNKLVLPWAGQSLQEKSDIRPGA